MSSVPSSTPVATGNGSASLARADALIVTAYLGALAAAALFLAYAPVAQAQSPLVAGAYADLVATATIFAFSLAVRNSSVYDAYWSVAPIPLAIYWALRGLALSAPSEISTAWVRTLFVLIGVLTWGVRLTVNWRRGWTGLGHEDWRYRDIREKVGVFYWPVSALGLHLFPTVQVFLGLIPACQALGATLDGAPARALGPLDALGLAVMSAGIAFEWIADAQLRRFVLARAAGTESRTTLDTGLWARARHPNYFGEMLLWWGLAIFGYAAAPGVWWQGAGAVSITAMFLFVSVPMIEKRMARRRPAYAERVRTVPAVIPSLRRRPRPS